jgi:hypothetical protein
MHFLNKVLKHFFCDLKICNDTIFQRTDGGNIPRGSAQHALGIDPNGCDGLLVIVLANRDNGRLVQNDAPLTHINECIGRSKIDGQIIRKQTSDFLEHRLTAQFLLKNYLTGYLNAPLCINLPHGMRHFRKTLLGPGCDDRTNDFKKRLYCARSTISCQL